MSSSNLVLTFEVYRGADLLARELFSEQSVTIGRGEAALLRVEDAGVSDLHCVINVEPDGSVMLLDLGSEQGTIHRGKRVQNANLGRADEFFVGMLRFRVSLGSAGEATVGMPDQDDPTDDGPVATPAPSAPRAAKATPQPAKQAAKATPQPAKQAAKATPAPAKAASGKSTPAPAPAKATSAPAKQAAKATPAPAKQASKATPPMPPPRPEDFAPEPEEEDDGSDTIMEDGLTFVMRSGTATHNLGVNEKRPKVLEVNQLWGDTLLDSRHYSHLGQRISVGPSIGYRWHFLGVDMGWVPAPLNLVLPFTPPMWSEIHPTWRNDFYASDDDLPGGRDHDLFTFENDQYVAHVPKAWDGFVDIGETRYSLDQLVEEGRAKADGNEYAVPMTDDLRLMVDAGGSTFYAHKVLAGTRLVSRSTEDPDYPFIAITSFMSFLGLMFGLMVFFMPARPSLGVNEIPDRFVEMAIDKPEPDPDKNKKPDANPDAGEGAKAKREEGKVGKKDAKMEKAKGNKVDVQQAQKDRQIAENAGLLGALADDGGMDGVFGSSALDSSLTGGVGGLIGAKGTQIGSGGLGSRGSGLGGGGTADGLGGLGTKGIGSGKSGYGSGGGNFGAKGEGGIGTVGGDPIILGALDRSLIDEVIKRHMSQIRYCYQRELAKAPNLGGKVVIKFVIAKDGTVSSASTKSTTMNNQAAEDCIVGRFMRMKFPEPKGGGIVIVSYPFIFTPG